MTVAEDQPNEVPARPASTVMLLRDVAGADGVEVFMLRRTTSAVFAGGMYVFPGGKVDPADGEEGSDEAYVIAAIRECFEEAGVLLATDDTGAMITDDHPALANRQAVYDGEVDLRALCAQHHLVPAVDALVWFSHWITPVGESSRRFDTRFFVATAPTSQLWAHDDNETIASEWVRPLDAVRRHEAGELVMMPPTIKSLEFLARHNNAESALAEARAVGRPRPIQPRLRKDETGRIRGISLPGDDDYADLV
jgi:8-oxo-dGTP pyrophosphatase MutT (NUDIX family)